MKNVRRLHNLKELKCRLVVQHTKVGFEIDEKLIISRYVFSTASEEKKL